MVVTAAVSAANPFPAFCCSSYRRPALLFSSPTIILGTRSSKFQIYGSIPQLDLPLTSPWSGLKHIGFPSRKKFDRRGKKGKCRGKIVYASLFGVGAPEALVIGVVALLVFGPKGLAEVARNLGKTLRAFQPTIRELQEVSREFKSTLEREIGLDEVASSTNNAYKPTSIVNENQQAVADPNGTPKAEAYTSEELLKITGEQLATSESLTQPSGPEEQPQEADATSEVATSTPASSEVAASAPATSTSASSEVAASASSEVAASTSDSSEVAASDIEVTASPSAPEIAAETSSSEKAENLR